MNETNSEAKDFNDVIFTPHFRADRYLHHVCSGCGYKVKIGHNFFNNLDFGETFNFCPNCGKPVIRFAQLPVFEEPPVEPALFEPIEKLFEQAKDKIYYYLYIQLSNDERKELVEKARFAKHLEEVGGPRSPVGTDIVLEYGDVKLSHWDKKKLIERIKCEQKCT